MTIKYWNTAITDAGMLVVSISTGIVPDVTEALRDILDIYLCEECTMMGLPTDQVTPPNENAIIISDVRGDIEKDQIHFLVKHLKSFFMVTVRTNDQNVDVSRICEE